MSRLATSALVSVLIASGLLLCRPATAATSQTPTTTPTAAARLPVRAFHALMPGYWGTDGRPQIAACEKFIREVLAPSGINVLVLEPGYNFQYHSVPRIGKAAAVGPDEVKRLLKACRQSGIKLIPEFNCLGHQATGPGTLIGEYPQYQEKPGEYPKNLKDPMPSPSIGTSYCPLHPEVHAVVFALLDELAGVFETDTIHVGMDEVFAIASSNCPRCGEKDPAVLFAGEVKAIHDHLTAKKLNMWMWGDRFILASEHGFVDWGWGSSRNYTYPAVDHVPKDIVICDWHYDVAPPTPQFFVDKGFATLACPWWNEGVALRYLLMMRELAASPDAAAAARSRGVMLTTWVEMQDFITAWEGRIPPLDQQPAWQRTGDFPWKAAKGSSAVLRCLAAAWGMTDQQLRQAIAESENTPRRRPSSTPPKPANWT